MTADQSVIDALTDQNTNKSATPPATGTPDLNAPHTMVVNGKQVTKPLNEWLADASKADGAQALFDAAADARKVAQAVDTINESKDPNEVKEAQRFLFKRSGLADDVVNQLLAEHGTSSTPEEETIVEDPRLAKLEARLSHYESLTEKSFEDRLNEQAEQTVTQNPELAVYLGTKDDPAPPGRQEQLVTVLRQHSVKLMNQRLAAGEKFAPNWIPEAAKAAVAEAKKFAERVIGAPSIGRAAETMLGPEIRQILMKDPEPLKPGMSKRDITANIRARLAHAAFSNEKSKV